MDYNGLNLWDINQKELKMRIIIIVVVMGSALLLSGCGGAIDFRPFAAAIITDYEEEATPISGQCSGGGDCGGKGYLGDGVVKVDCPSCEVSWEQPETDNTLEALPDDKGDSFRLGSGECLRKIYAEQSS